MKLVPIGVLALTFAAACGGSNEGAAPAASPAPTTTTTTTTTTAPATAPASEGSPEGGECSDDVAVQKKCAPGLVCGPPKPGAPVSEHTPGVCKKP